MSQIFSDQYYSSCSFNMFSKLDGETISQKPRTPYLEKIKNFFIFKQSPDLLAVNKKIHEVLNSPEKCKQLQNELYTKGIQSGIIQSGIIQSPDSIFFKLSRLNKSFEHGNKKRLFTLLLLRVVNFVRGIVGWEKIQLQKYHLVDMEKFRKLFQDLELTPEDQKKVLVTLSTKNEPKKASNLFFSEADELNEKNIQKLKLQLLSGIKFSDGIVDFKLTFDQLFGTYNLDLHYSFLRSRSEQEIISVQIDTINSDGVKNSLFLSKEISFKRFRRGITLISGTEYQIKIKGQDAPFCFTLGTK